jgi:hypothetical protein
MMSVSLWSAWRRLIRARAKIRRPAAQRARGPGGASACRLPRIRKCVLLERMPEPKDPGWAREARIDLGGHPAPPRPYIRPRHAAAEVQWSDKTWRPCTIVAWCQLAEPVEEMMTMRHVTWLVRLRTVDGDENWWGYAPGYLRPVGPPPRVGRRTRA